jgi:predicted nucleic acid-binding protein
MALAYVDTSCLVAIALGEPGATAIARRLNRFDQLLSSNLLEAELRAAFKRERVDGSDGILESVGWIIPDRPLTEEIKAVLEAGQVRGADCWHLATALYLAPETGALAFMTLDARQREVASALGFQV